MGVWRAMVRVQMWSGCSLVYSNSHIYIGILSFKIKRTDKMPRHDVEALLFHDSRQVWHGNSGQGGRMVGMGDVQGLPMVNKCRIVLVYQLPCDNLEMHLVFSYSNL